MKKFTAILFSIFCMFSLSGCGKKADPVYIPDTEAILSAVLSAEETEETVTEPSQIREIADGLRNAAPTSKQSIQDVPAVEFYLKIELKTETGTDTFFVWPDGKNFYIEQPYQGIYKTDGEFYERLNAVLHP